MVCVGTRRIRVNAWLPDDPYPLADVDDWLDDESGLFTRDELAVHIAATTARVRRTCALANELGYTSADPSSEISDDPLVASYQLVALSPIGPADEYRLLCADGPAQRLDLLDAALDDAEALLRFQLTAPDDDPVD
jgi:uncharacterized protein